MDVTITVVTGGGKKATRRSHTVTMKEVQFMEQVTDCLKTEFKGFFDVNKKLGKD